MNGVKREKRPFGMVAPSRTTEIGGTRVARSAGNNPARSVTTMPTIRETTTVRGREDEAGLRQRQVERREQLVQPLGQQEPEPEPDDRGEHADDQRLEQHRHADLPARRTERPERRELARPLGDGDRHRVEDDEGAHEERDDAEASRKYRMIYVNSATSALLLRLRDAGLDRDVCGERAPDRCTSWSEVTPSVAAT